MTALITVDCLGKRFDARILASEPVLDDEEKQPIQDGEKKQTEEVINTNNWVINI